MGEQNLSDSKSEERINENPQCDKSSEPDSSDEKQQEDITGEKGSPSKTKSNNKETASNSEEDNKGIASNATKKTSSPSKKQKLEDTKLSKLKKKNKNNEKPSENINKKMNQNPNDSDSDSSDNDLLFSNRKNNISNNIQIQKTEQVIHSESNFSLFSNTKGLDEKDQLNKIKSKIDQENSSEFEIAKKLKLKSSALYKEVEEKNET